MRCHQEILTEEVAITEGGGALSLDAEFSAAVGVRGAVSHHTTALLAAQKAATFVVARAVHLFAAPSHALLCIETIGIAMAQGPTLGLIETVVMTVPARV
jgi:hypothetical protein